MTDESVPIESRDLSVTALYTAEVWRKHAFTGAAWFSGKDSRVVYGFVRAFLLLQKLFRWGLPGLKEGLIQRHQCIDQLILEEKAPHVVELAAGLSSRFCRVLSGPHVESYTEVDLADMVKEKGRRLSESEGRDWLQDPRYRRLTGDVRNLQEIERHIPEGNVDVIAEGLMMYFSPGEQHEIFTEIVSLIQLRRHGRLVFDLLPPSEEPAQGWFGKLLETAMKWFTKGGSFDRTLQTRKEIEESLLKAGFSDVKMICPAQRTGLFPGQHTRQLIFVARSDAHSIIERDATPA